MRKFTARVIVIWLLTGFLLSCSLLRPATDSAVTESVITGLPTKHLRPDTLLAGDTDIPHTVQESLPPVSLDPDDWRGEGNYSVQLLADSSYSQAHDSLIAILQLFPERRLHLTWEKPFWKIRTRGVVDRQSAEQALSFWRENELSEAWIVHTPEPTNLPPDSPFQRIYTIQLAAMENEPDLSRFSYPRSQLLVYREGEQKKVCYGRWSREQDALAALSEIRRNYPRAFVRPVILPGVKSNP